MEMEDAAVKINQIQKGSIVVDLSVAVQSKKPNGLIKVIHENLLSSLQQKYDIQELQIHKGKHCTANNDCMNACPLLLITYNM